jgi:hypothetical protein
LSLSLSFEKEEEEEEEEEEADLDLLPFLFFPPSPLPALDCCENKLDDDDDVPSAAPALPSRFFFP